METSNIAKPFENNLSKELRYQRLKQLTRQLFSQLQEQVLEELLLKFKWIELARGDVICREGEAADSLYLLVTGRLKAMVGVGTPGEHEVGEISQGETVGEMAMITGEARTATIHAIRHCTLVQLHKTDFDNLVRVHPEVVINLSRIIINRLKYTMHHTSVPAKTNNIALVPSSDSPAINQLIQQLLHALNQECQLRHLHKDSFPPEFKKQLLTNEEPSFELINWLAEQEMEQEYVIYEAEPFQSLWTKQCLRQADKIIIFTEADKGPDLTPIEKSIFNENGQHGQTIELVVLYQEETEMPALTHKFLEFRNVKRHYNIRMNDSRHSSRLARMILGRGIGLVLGGGGAKGFAHIGIYRALQEANVPIDMVCGTSIGAIIAAGIAYEWSPEQLIEKGRSAFITDKPLNDYTLPVISLIKGHKLQKINRKYFADYNIEDVWLNFFCISSNYTLSEMVIHERGPMWKAITASVSIPGVLPPVVFGNNLLVDGGSFNNFPVDVMKSRYGGRLIGVNLLIDKEYKLNYTTLPGGWHMFFSRFLPFLRRYKTPSISAIMLKSTILSSMVQQRKQVNDLDLFMTPPVGPFGLLDMNKFDQIVATGYEYGQVYLKEVNLDKFKSRTKVLL